MTNRGAHGCQQIAVSGFLAELPERARKRAGGRRSVGTDDVQGLWFVPTDSDIGARCATVHSELSQIYMPTASPNHYAGDAGAKGEAKAPVRKYSLVATSVVIGQRP